MNFPNLNVDYRKPKTEAKFLLGISSFLVVFFVFLQLIIIIFLCVLDFDGDNCNNTSIYNRHIQYKDFIWFFV